MRKLRFGLAGLVLIAAIAPAAMAAPVGKVEKIGGGNGDVFVLRGGQPYTLTAGSELFAGDQVFTRVGGAVDLTYFKCAKALKGASSIVVSADCNVPATTLSSSAKIGNVPIGAPAGGLPYVPPALAGVVGAGVVGGVLVANNGSRSN